MPEIHRFRKRPVECEAILLKAYGDFVRAKDWINANGGKAFHYQTGPSGSEDRLVYDTIDGNLVEMSVGSYVVRGIQGEFYPCKADIFEASHEPLDAPHAEALTGTGSYVRGAPDGSQSLTGGAAKRFVGGATCD